MNIELVHCLSRSTKAQWLALLAQAGLEADTNTEQTALVWDGDTLVAAGSRQGSLLKCIAVEASHQGEDLTAAVISALRQSAFQAGHRHLFLYTKPINQAVFSSLFFYPVAQTDTVLLMEDQKDGIHTFLNTLPAASAAGTVGAAVMNCDPFTLGHRYLIETAAAECDQLYVFVLSEEKSRFSAADRLEMVRRGTAELPNVTVLPTGPYLISSATFPTYFLKERDRAATIHCLLDIAIFVRYFAPRFGITRRYVGTEPYSNLTAQYNAALREQLPNRGIALRELPRLEHSGMPVSAGTVRALLDAGDTEAAAALVPQTTFSYLQDHDLL